MEFQTISRECVALLIHKSPCPEPETAALLVRFALAIKGLKMWPRMEVDLFPAGHDTLIVARPAAEIIVTIADYALPFLQEN